ncbi:MAG: prolipoprotein diacylglyceryl transferase [Candidatus Borkfalkiaceae bacterium]|nr:prolipoprotein diacylglyceryl transferase [Christensenellaceae bacterium]
MHPQPLFEFSLFGKDLSVYPYGIMTAIGIISAIVVFYIYTKKKNMPTKVQDFTFFVIIVAIATGFLFAKLYQAFYDFLDTGTWDFYGAGITAMGGFLGGAAAFVAVYFVAGKFYFKGKYAGLHKREFEKIFCVAPLCIVIAHAFGRIGCLMAGCCHGELVSKTEWVIGTVPRYTYSSATHSTSFSGYYVATQLYEALFLFALFAALSVLYFKKYKRLTMPVYLVAYGIWRIIIEVFRTDYRGAEVLGLYPSQWQSIVFIILGIAVLAFYIIKKIPLVCDDIADEPHIKESEPSGSSGSSGGDGGEHASPTDGKTETPDGSDESDKAE